MRRPTKRDASLLVFTTMATLLSQLALHKEGRLKLAVQAYKKGYFLSYTAAVNAYDVVRSTLQRRITGIPA